MAHRARAVAKAGYRVKIKEFVDHQLTCYSNVTLMMEDNDDVIIESGDQRKFDSVFGNFGMKRDLFMGVKVEKAPKKASKKPE